MSSPQVGGTAADGTTFAVERMNRTGDVGNFSREKEEFVERASELKVPRTRQEVCNPRRMALLVYDMQVSGESFELVIPHASIEGEPAEEHQWMS